ncbi:MAG: serine/threonine-protein phosphatase [Brevinematales bacterium]|nr:serine/threonine-protein phosphatase [Brevinematales bacterium]
MNLEKKVKDRTNDLEEERNKLKQRNELIENDLSMARRIQSRLIPRLCSFANVAFYYKPMDKVGGDFFDFIKLDDEKLGIFISDVSGHGVPAALITSMIKSFTFQFAPYIQNPSEFLELLNQSLYNQTDGNFVTAFYGIYDIKKRILSYSNAGHNLPFLIDKKHLINIESIKGGVPLAIFENSQLLEMGKKFADKTLTVKKNSKIIFYTDGLLEATRISEIENDSEIPAVDFETAELNDLMRANFNLSPTIFIAEIVQNLISFRGCDNFEDDICLICLEA